MTLFFRRLYSDISAKSALEIVQTAISEVNEQNDGEQAIDTALETVLLGPGGVADSLILVNIVVAVEQNLEAQTGAYVTLIEDDTVLGDDGPLRTIGSLVEFVAGKMG